LSKQLVATARDDQRCRLLTSVPGVGTIAATAFAAAVEDPANFKNSRAAGAWIRLTTPQLGHAFDIVALHS